MVAAWISMAALKILIINQSLCVFPLGYFLQNYLEQEVKDDLKGLVSSSEGPDGYY